MGGASKTHAPSGEDLEKLGESEGEEGGEEGEVGGKQIRGR